MGKSTISMAIFNSYVKLPEGMWIEVWKILQCLTPQVPRPQVAQALRVLHLPDPPVPHAAGNMLERDWLKPLYVDVENDYNII